MPRVAALSPSLTHESVARIQDGGEAIEILFVSRLAHRLQGLRNIGIIKRLLSLNERATINFAQSNRQRKKRLAIMPNRHTLIALNLRKNIRVPVIRPIRPMHREFPLTTRHEVETMDGVFETIRPPPLRELRRILNRTKYFRARERQNTLCT